MGKTKSGFLKSRPAPEPDEGKYRHTSGMQKNDTAETESTESNSSTVQTENESVPNVALGDETPVNLKRGRSRKADIVRESGAAHGLHRGNTRYTLVINKQRLLWFKDYAYTHRISLREAIDTALIAFQQTHKDDTLLPNPKARK